MASAGNCENGASALPNRKVVLNTALPNRKVVLDTRDSRRRRDHSAKSLFRHASTAASLAIRQPQSWHWWTLAENGVSKVPAEAGWTGLPAGLLREFESPGPRLPAQNMEP
jgi:hypothetical protein